MISFVFFLKSLYGEFHTWMHGRHEQRRDGGSWWDFAGCMGDVDSSVTSTVGVCGLIVPGMGSTI